MISLPQNDEDEIEENIIVPQQKAKKESPSNTMIFKALLFIIIIFVLIISYNIYNKNNKVNISEKIGDNINKNEEENKIIKDNKNKDNNEDINKDNNKDINKDNKNKKNNDENHNNDKNKEIKSDENIKTDDINKNKTDDIDKNKTDDINKHKTDDVNKRIEKTDKIEDIIIKEIDLSIIINSYNKNNDLTTLVKNILSKDIENCEIIITSNYIFDNNQKKNIEKEINDKKIMTKFIEYEENTKRLKMKLDSSFKTSGKYIIFIDPEETLSLDIFKDYKNVIKNDIDIIQYDLDFDRIGNNKITYQPQLYESLFFGGRDSFDFNHFHVNGKLYKSEIFIEATKNIDKLYLEQSDKYYDEIMIIILVFQKANTFIIIKQSKSCNRDKCQKYQYKRYNYNKEILKDTILFIRFLYEYTGKDKVQEKRMAAKIFQELFISKGVKTFYNDELLKLMNDTIDLYINSELINDLDKNPIKNYRVGIKK